MPYHALHLWGLQLVRHHPIPNFALHELGIAQRKHEVWSKFIYFLESGDETSLPRLPIPFSQFFLSQEKVPCRYLAEKAESVEQFLIPEIFVPVVLKLIHDKPIAGHLGRDRTLTAERRVNYWPKMSEDIDNYVARCVTCAWPQVRSRCSDIRHLSNLGTLSQWIYSNYQRVDLAQSIFWCALTTFHALWFLRRSKTKHQQSNGLVERVNRKILDALQPAVNNLHDNWDDWPP